MELPRPKTLNQEGAGRSSDRHSTPRQPKPWCYDSIQALALRFKSSLGITLQLKPWCYAKAWVAALTLQAFLEVNYPHPMRPSFHDRRIQRALRGGNLPGRYRYFLEVFASRLIVKC